MSMVPPNVMVSQQCSIDCKDDSDTLRSLMWKVDSILQMLTDAFPQLPTSLYELFQETHRDFSRAADAVADDASMFEKVTGLAREIE